MYVHMGNDLVCFFIEHLIFRPSALVDPRLEQPSKELLALLQLGLLLVTVPLTPSHFPRLEIWALPSFVASTQDSTVCLNQMLKITCAKNNFFFSDC